jgi:hypothetical protein
VATQISISLSFSGAAQLIKDLHDVNSRIKKLVFRLVSSSSPVRFATSSKMRAAPLILLLAAASNAATLMVLFVH